MTISEGFLRRVGLVDGTELLIERDAGDITVAIGNGDFFLMVALLDLRALITAIAQVHAGEAASVELRTAVVGQLQVEANVDGSMCVSGGAFQMRIESDAIAEVLGALSEADTFGRRKPPALALVPSC